MPELLALRKLLIFFFELGLSHIITNELHLSERARKSKNMKENKLNSVEDSQQPASPRCVSAPFEQEGQTRI